MDSDDDNHQNNLIKNEELVEYHRNLDKLNRWVIPSVPPNQIYRFGLNSSIMAYVRYGRCKDFKQSLAAMLTVHTDGYNFKPGSEIIAICYRIYYKVLTTLNPKVKQLAFPGTTTLVQTNLLTSNVATNRLIKWDEINFPETWSLPQEIDPEPILNRDIDQIIQTTKGDLEINFTPKRIIRIPRSLSARHSVSEFFTASSQLPRPSTSQTR
ncbi:hypothetical protein KIW84_065466 [Lathyrus oleraceus]|uniref:Uncharacterized protein n=1 Tax=Pisum sativum TaxID=3888 RepID=A0A9D4WD21_PEA|nr:hypothetical protein KIW84_065466 [Pisum sativum]